MKGSFFLFVFGMAIISAAYLITVEGRFTLSCRVISNICENDGSCIEEIGLRFPDCFIDGSNSEVPSESSGGAAIFALNKRVPGVKLLKVLMMKDRIPGGKK